MTGWRASVLAALLGASNSLPVDAGIFTGIGIGLGTAAAFVTCLVLRMRRRRPDIATVTLWTAGFGAACGVGVAIIDHVFH
jgi:hypothetical protein